MMLLAAAPVTEDLPTVVTLAVVAKALKLDGFLLKKKKVLDNQLEVKVPEEIYEELLRVILREQLK